MWADADRRRPLSAAGRTDDRRLEFRLHAQIGSAQTGSSFPVPSAASRNAGQTVDYRNDQRELYSVSSIIGNRRSFMRQGWFLWQILGLAALSLAVCGCPGTSPPAADQQSTAEPATPLRLIVVDDPGLAEAVQQQWKARAEGELEVRDDEVRGNLRSAPQATGRGRRDLSQRADRRIGGTWLDCAAVRRRDRLAGIRTARYFRPPSATRDRVGRTGLCRSAGFSHADADLPAGPAWRNWASSLRKPGNNTANCASDCPSLATCCGIPENGRAIGTRWPSRWGRDGPVKSCWPARRSMLATAATLPRCSICSRWTR